LAVVVVLSMIKDIFEDYKRHKSDQQENEKRTLVYDASTDGFHSRPWHQVKVGDIVKVMGDEFFPADMVFCRSSEPQGVCYVETKNLDGETNLKHKVAEKLIHKRLAKQERLDRRLDGFVQCEIPNDQIYKFEGSYTLTDAKRKVSLNSEHILLRGSSLRNTEWIIGLVVYAGHQTKVMMNSSNAKYKMSTIEKGTNRQIILIFLV
jgi:magnesium-transporting ATPase (P-type)